MNATLFSPANLRVLQVPLVIADQFNIESIFSLKTENDAPVCPHRHRPETAKLAFERMQAIAGEVERLRRRRLIEAAQNVFYVAQ
jgi:hypothetical protein